MSIMSYQFEQNPIRIVCRNNEPWFVAADVCKCNQLRNQRVAILALDDDERSKFNLPRQGETWIINESGLFTLILRSRNATKKGTVQHTFRKWVTSEVLPSLRQIGNYEMPKDTTIARIQGKQSRRAETDAIALLVAYAKQQGSNNAERYYCNITKLVNAQLFNMKSGSPKYDGFRDTLNVIQLSFLNSTEQIVTLAIHDGLARGEDYKEIYKHIKKRVSEYLNVVNAHDLLAVDDNQRLAL